MDVATPLDGQKRRKKDKDMDDNDDDDEYYPRCPAVGGEGGRNLSILPAAPLRPWHASDLTTTAGRASPFDENVCAWHITVDMDDTGL